MNPATESAHQFLDEIYHGLGYQEGKLLDAVQTPQPNSKEAKFWIDIGDWLATAKKVNAEKIFFVNNDPVIVFSAYEQYPNEDEILHIFRRVWCMARPQRFFLSLPGELRVYDLKEPPINSDGNPVEPLISTTHAIADVLEELQAYRREQLEAGCLPENERLFGKPDARADRRLIQDLREVRKSLRKQGLKPEHAHALIGRSIFICYLEDRGVLTEAYFRQVAENHSEWIELLEQHLEKPEIKANIRESELKKRWYCNVLQNKDFTYALFDKLAEDFNGDLFPKDDAEKDTVKQKPHLDLLRGLLLRDANPTQPNLFFWVYDFEIIPIELISSIYEEFYHNEVNGDDNTTHYTPSVLAEFMLSHVLPEERLAITPKILDPACGSGIFLVEAFRRIVRYRIKEKGDSLSAIELREILHKQIRGIEINSGAIYVAAFSLYLALLHYQKPPDILAQIQFPQADTKPLPHLLFDGNHLQDNNYYHILFNVNTFALMESERTQLKQELDAHPKRSRLKKFYESSGTLVIEPNSFDIIIGNPPWGFVRKRKTTLEIQRAQVQAQEWCSRFGWSIGDKELSQAFMARSLSLLKPGGECGFLVSTGIFFKGHVNSQTFRQRWLSESTIKTVVNFAHVREVFFTAISPFAFVHYKALLADFNHRIHYWSAKRIKIVENSQSVVLHLSDIKRIRQYDLEHNEQLWKVYWWGNHRDAALVNILNLDKSLGILVDERLWDNGQGYTPGAINLSNQAVYKFTQQAYLMLSEENIPSEILIQLKPLIKKDNKTEKNFLRALEKAIGKEQTAEYGKVIRDYSQNYLKKYHELSIKNNFRRYGLITEHELTEVPDTVHRYGNFGVYQGWRLIIKRGITQEKDANGRIDSRLEHISYCFRNSGHGINMSETEEWERKTLIGILWSSLARYYYFMTVGSWITWHCEILFAPIMSLPIRFPEDLKLKQRIVQIVDELRNRSPDRRSILKLDGQEENDISERLTLLERELDEAIFDLYELSEPERDLIWDMCETGLEFFYRKSQSNAVQSVEVYPKQLQGTFQGLPQRRDLERGLEGYLYAFLDMWNDELEPDGEFHWRVIYPTKSPMLAVVFTTQNKGNSLPELTSPDKEWADILEKIEKVSNQPISRNIYLDGIVRRVTDTEIFIIKRNERRLWTRSLAREDAEATLLQAIQLQKAHRNAK